MTIYERVKKKLTDALRPELLQITDQSELHKGHGGYREGGETHFHIEIVASAFDGVSPVERHRKIYKLLEKEMNERIHALEIHAKAKSLG